MGTAIKTEAKHAIRTKKCSALCTHMPVLLMQGLMTDNSNVHQGFNPRRD